MGGLLKYAVSCLLVTATMAPALGADAVATLHWARRVELGAPVSGTVSAVPANPGDRVRRGQALVELDPRRFRARLAKAKAGLDQARLAREEAQREEERAVELYDRTVLSNRDVELARIDYAAAKAAYETAQAALTQAELDFEYSVVRAPFEGVVVSRDAEVGQTVISTVQAATLVILAQAGTMRARALLPGERVTVLSAGQSADVVVGGERYSGEITAIALEPVERDGESLYPVDVVFRFDPARDFRVGQSAIVKLP
jgi:multidrug efflux system membrane fusion protein